MKSNLYPLFYGDSWNNIHTVVASGLETRALHDCYRGQIETP